MSVTCSFFVPSSFRSQRAVRQHRSATRHTDSARYAPRAPDSNHLLPCRQSNDQKGRRTEISASCNGNADRHRRRLTRRRVSASKVDSSVSVAGALIHRNHRYSISLPTFSRHVCPVMTSHSHFRSVRHNDNWSALIAPISCNIYAEHHQPSSAAYRGHTLTIGLETCCLHLSSRNIFPIVLQRKCTSHQNHEVNCFVLRPRHLCVILLHSNPLHNHVFLDDGSVAVIDQSGPWFLAGRPKA